MSASSQQSKSEENCSGAAAVIEAIVSGVVRFVVVVGLIGGGVYAAYWFNTTSGTAKKTEQASDQQEASRLVVVDVADRRTVPVRVRAMGTVMPAREAVLRPRVEGTIVEQHDDFVPGGFFEAGTFMVQIERADYEQTIEQRESDLERAQAALQIELGDQAVAREELELLKVDIPELNRDLILRIPQVNQARAEVRSAEAALKRARLNLDRTRIVAPFTGQVVEREVTVGNNVGAGDALATFVGAEEYWIELTLPVSSLRWIEVADDDTEGSPADIRYVRAWGPDALRRGVVARRIGRLEQGSRLARVMVSVPDPLARSEERADQPELILGAFVSVEIEGKPLDDAVVIDRDLVREDDVVWVMGPDNRLQIRAVTIAYRGPDEAYVTDGIEDGDRVIRTNLTAPVEGMLLRLADQTTPTAPVAQADAEDSGGG